MKTISAEIRAYLSANGRAGGSRKVAKGFASPRVQAKAQATRAARRPEKNIAPDAK